MPTSRHETAEHEWQRRFRDSAATAARDAVPVETLLTEASEIGRSILAATSDVLGHAPLRDALAGHLARQLAVLVSGWPAEDRTAVSVRDVPLLPGLVTRIASNWMNEVWELSDRLARDARLLRRSYFHGRRRMVTNLTPARSDPHHGGRTVHIVEFEDTRLVYKPRPIAVEVKFQDFAAWFGEVLGHRLRPVAMLDRGDYGWCEHIDFRPFREPRDVEQFFVRAGVIVFLCYVTGLTDCHADNVSFTADGPVVLDAETVLHPDFLPESIPWSQPPDTVLRSGMVHTLSRMNVDAAHRAALMEGFSCAYEVVMSDRTVASETRRRLLAFSGYRSRVVFRATSFYKEIVNQSLSPAALTSAENRLRSLDAVVAPFRPIERRALVWPLLESELLSLATLDIPHFVTRTDGMAVTDGGSSAATPILATSGLSAALRRIDSLDRAHLEWMKTVIDAALSLRSPADTETPANLAREPLATRAVPVPYDRQ